MGEHFCHAKKDEHLLSLGFQQIQHYYDRRLVTIYASTLWGI